MNYTIKIRIEEMAYFPYTFRFELLGLSMFFGFTAKQYINYLNSLNHRKRILT